MRALLFVHALLAFTLPPSLAVIDSVDLGYANYYSDTTLAPGVTSFLGMRYAAPPIGTLRFSHPRPPVDVQTGQNASERGPACPQYGPIYGFNTTSPYRNFSGLPIEPMYADFGWDEDCLFIDVHIPTEVTINSTLPVVVWIHGGGYDGGSSTEYPAESFVRNANYSLISVQFQYRLGVFGFLAGEEVRKDGVLNAGLLDQEYALRWVQKHILKFGGDPDQVTIWGESSGAGSVLQQVIANGGETKPPLFKAAIISSLFLPFQYKYDDPIPQAIYDAVVDGAGCAGSVNSLECLRSANATELLGIDQTISYANFMGIFTFVPVIDGTFIEDRPTSLLKAKRVNSNALLAVTNAHEGNLFTDPAVLVSNDFTLPQYLAQFFPRMDSSQISDAVNIYGSIPGTNLTTQAALIAGESIFVCPTYYVLDAFPEATSWKARFTVPPALHGTDLSYEFSGYGTPPDFTNEKFLHSFRNIFFSMVASSNPNAVEQTPDDLTPDWQTWRPEMAEMMFGESVGGLPDIRLVNTEHDVLERCAFWQSIANINSQ